MKSKIPCEPGPAPLMKLAQATGLCGGMLVRSGRKPPCLRSRSRCGSSPAFIMASDKRGSMPSTPMTITRGTSPRRLDLSRHPAIVPNPAAQAAAAAA